MSTQLAAWSQAVRGAAQGSAERPASSPAAAPAGVGLLLASGCGTAVAAVCATGILSITSSAPGIWAGLAVLCGGGLAWLLANAFAFLGSHVPGRAGLFAYLGRGLGRSAALLLTLPYLLASLALVGAEAYVVGRLLARAAGGPDWPYALGFLICTWLLCRRGVKLSLRLQALCTWLLLSALALLALYTLLGGLQRGLLLPRLSAPVPSLLSFITAVSQALFLFMGFELVTSQDEPAPPATLAAALRGSVLVLTGFYALLALAFAASPLADRSGLTGPMDLAGGVVPQLALAEGAAGQPAVWLIAGLSLLASYTSFNGALLALSRLGAALATLGYLPARFAQIDATSLLPRRALLWLLVIGVVATFLVRSCDLLLPAILAAAPLAALVYAGIAWAQQARAFASAPRPRRRRLLGRALAPVLATIALGSLLALGETPQHARPVLILLGSAYAATLLSLFRPALRRWRGSR